MFGLFLVNDKQQVAFAQFGQHVTVEAFRYVADAKLCVAIHSGGAEEMFTTELPAVVADRLGEVESVLVAHLDDDGKTVGEYVVPVQRTG